MDIDKLLAKANDMHTNDYTEEILQLRKALADVADECSKVYEIIEAMKMALEALEDDVE